MIHFKGKGEHSVFELEKIILEQQEQLHQKQIEIQKMTDWVSIKEKLPSEYDNVLIINSDLEMFVAAYDPIMNDFEGFYGTVTHWRLIF